MLQTLDGTFFGFVVILIAFYGGALVWRDRDARLDEISDSLPTPDWLSCASRLAALVAMALSVQCLALLCGLGAQAWHGYHRYQLGLYLAQLLLRDGSLLVFLAVLTLFIQALTLNKNLGHLLVIAFLITNVFVWRPLNVATYLVRFAGRPPVTHSDFFGDAPVPRGLGLVHAVLAARLRPAGDRQRGRSGLAAGRPRWRERLRIARLRFRGGLRLAAAACLLLVSATGAWIAYNTMVLNRAAGPEGPAAPAGRLREELQALRGAALPTPAQRAATRSTCFPRRATWPCAATR